jgi:hypothetical protein
MARPHGRARVSQSYPQAHAICDRCGFEFLHADLTWQYDFQGPRLANKYILVCRTCMDVPFQHNRTIILPPDPVPIANPRPENYVLADTPVSYSLWEPLALVRTPTQSGNIGTMSNVDAAFRAPANKGSGISALSMTSIIGPNYLGKNWCAQTGGPTSTPSPLTATGVTYNIGSFVAQAPADQSFLKSGATALEFDGWSGSAWVPLWSGTSAGTANETVSVTLGSSAQGQYYAHRLVLTGDGTRLAVASLTINAISDGVVATAPAVQPS